MVQCPYLIRIETAVPVSTRVESVPIQRTPHCKLSLTAFCAVKAWTVRLHTEMGEFGELARMAEHFSVRAPLCSVSTLLRCRRSVCFLLSASLFACSKLSVSDHLDCISCDLAC